MTDVTRILTAIEQGDAKKGDLVKRRYFAGLTLELAAEMPGLSPTTAKRYWTDARAWLYREIAGRQ